MAEPTRYLGKYRGTVVTNTDPLGIGRIQAQVPDVLGDAVSTWAMPCFPVAGPGMGHYAVPPVGAGVWLEFEQGDQSYPIWTGCWYGSASEVPVEATTGPPGVPNMVLETSGRRVIVLSDDPTTGITLRIPSGASIVINDSGIRISNGQGASIALVGATVTINQDALSVT
ncbi:baseplate assembly protein [Kitasatospora xanthocidica]|uniref:Baseplate assembly protein n=1 Tax=Kitasatospora xanthocidica TaxID=83382 RepID=A0A372ZQE7_9ACTN|nr:MULTISPECIES: phage baseplate assembly protein V [Streptomycetaceae]OKH97888.1 baseplate assembly protein [Streptomyces sp. CB02056]RGD58073.1 baseplate assembly protein [Kitasatospora xanthocidica]